MDAPSTDALLDRILRRGELSIENVIVTVGYTEFVKGEPQYAIQEPQVQVKWKANSLRLIAERTATWRRFWPTSRIGLWLYDSIFSNTYVESTKPTLREALVEIDEKTRPPFHYLDELVAENEHWKQGARIVEGLIRSSMVVAA